MTLQLLGVCGSLQKHSSNLQLLAALHAHSPADISLTIFDGLRHLPLFNPDLLSEGRVPQSVRSWQAALAASNALIIASPEYGHSLPGALKNAIDWVIGSGELYNMPIAITAAVRDPERGLRGLAALHQTLVATDANVFWADTVLVNEPLPPQLDALLTALTGNLPRQPELSNESE